MSGSAQRKVGAWDYKFPDDWKFDYETKKSPAPAASKPASPAARPSAQVVPLPKRPKPAAASKAAIPAPTQAASTQPKATVPQAAVSVQHTQPKAQAPATKPAAASTPAIQKPQSKPRAAVPPAPTSAPAKQTATTPVVHAPQAQVRATEVPAQSVLPLAPVTRVPATQAKTVQAAPKQRPAEAPAAATLALQEKVGQLQASLQAATQAEAASTKAATRAEASKEALERKLAAVQAELDEARQTVARLGPELESERSLRRASDARVHESEARYGEECKKTGMLERQVRDLRSEVERLAAEARKAKPDSMEDATDDAARVFGRMSPEAVGIRRATTERVSVPGPGPGGRTRSVEVVHSAPQRTRLPGEIPASLVVAGPPQEGTLTLGGLKQTGPRVDVTAAYRQNPERMLMMQEQGGGKFLPQFSTTPPPNAAKPPEKVEAQSREQEAANDQEQAKSHPLVIETAKFVVMAKILPRRPDLGNKVRDVLGRIRAGLSEMELGAYASAAMVGMAGADA